MSEAPRTATIGAATPPNWLAHQPEPTTSVAPESAVKTALPATSVASRLSPASCRRFRWLGRPVSTYVLKSVGVASAHGRQVGP
jgi:hypothetical protein